MNDEEEPHKSDACLIEAESSENIEGKIILDAIDVCLKEVEAYVEDLEYLDDDEDIAKLACVWACVMKTSGMVIAFCVRKLGIKS